jgi:hypothetical protein
MILPFPREVAQRAQDWCEHQVQLGNARCLHDGFGQDIKTYTKVYIITVLRKNPFDPNKARVKFIYHTKEIDIRGKKVQVERGDINITVEDAVMLLETMDIGGLVNSLGLHFVNVDGNIDTRALMAVMEQAVKLVNKTEGQPEINVILDEK